MTGRRPIHLVGIGGAGMSGLARLAAAAGYSVSGTDRSESPTLDALRQVGVQARAGHSAALPAETAAIVVSTAVAEDTPDLVEGRRRGLPVMHRADLLAELMRGHRGLTVAGAHGKSTTSAMLRLMLGGASACIGATIEGGSGTGAVWGDGPWFVAEADESDRSLLKLAPHATILLNVDHDHHSTYASIDEVEEVFAAHLATVPSNGLVVAGPDARAWRLAVASGRPCRLIGAGADAWGDVVDVDTGRALNLTDGRLVELPLMVPGRHNATNAACAIALADWCGVPPEVATVRLRDFAGVGRRFELRGEVAGIRIVDDYAHHPEEVAATLAGARETHDGRIIAVFQPHLFSRTRALAAAFGEALAAADVAIVTDVYAAREPDDPEIDGTTVTRTIPSGTVAVHAPSLPDAVREVLARVRPGDLVLTIGAGDITTLGQELTLALQNQYGDGDSAGG